MNMNTIFYSFVIFLTSISVTYAAKPAKTTPVAKASAQVAAPAQEKLLWDAWYLITINGKMPIGYYNERAEIRKDRVYVQTHTWRKEGEFINEEQLGAYAEDNAALTPLFFNSHMNYRATELTIDGTMTGGTHLSVQIKRDSESIAPIKKVVPAKTIFTQHFSVWLGRNLKGLEPNKSLTFMAILESDLDRKFAVDPGRVKLEAPDEFSKANHALKIQLEYQNQKNIWYIEPTGVAIRMIMLGKTPDTTLIVERTTQEKAKQSL